MAAITQQQIIAAYALARKVFDGTLKGSDAVRVLEKQHGMNRSSAMGYINVFRHLRASDLYTRTINTDATAYYLQNILRDDGPDAAELARSALEKHIAYYEGLGGSGMPALKAISSEIASAIGAARHKDESDDFAAAVAASMTLPEAERRAKLNPPGTKPPHSLQQVRIFVRNQHVAAAVLLRANGTCEGCGLPAPFIRKSNGLHYLEVHHKIRLADNGDDTVENAIALCPNCHRKAHFG